ncbi:MAG: hypothetical protein FWF33_07465 [Clostridiales bacterium]|nr:hypothetical protein [Clostridiales bacterium]
MKKKVITIVSVIVFFAVVAILYALIFAIPKIEGLSVKTEVVDYEDLPVEDAVHGIFVRNETLYLAQASGKPQYLISEGTKVRRGMQVFTVDTAGAVSGQTPQKIADVAKIAGADAQPSDGGIAPETAIVSYYADGYEKKIIPDKINGMTKSMLGTLPQESTSLIQDQIRAGDPAYKITDNNEWYFVFWRERTAHEASKEQNAGQKAQDAMGGSAATPVKDGGATIDDYTKGRTVTLDLGTTRVTATVESVTMQQDNWFIVLKSDMYYKDLSKYRQKDANVIFAEYQGAVISNTAIKEENGVTGVYVRQQSGTWKWVPVKVLRQTSDKSIVAEEVYYDSKGAPVQTVSYYDEVLTDPKEAGY